MTLSLRCSLASRFAPSVQWCGRMKDWQPASRTALRAASSNPSTYAAALRCCRSSRRCCHWTTSFFTPLTMENAPLSVARLPVGMSAAWCWCCPTLQGVCWEQQYPSAAALASAAAWVSCPWVCHMSRWLPGLLPFLPLPLLPPPVLPSRWVPPLLMVPALLPDL